MKSRLAQLLQLLIALQLLALRPNVVEAFAPPPHSRQASTDRRQQQWHRQQARRHDGYHQGNAFPSSLLPSSFAVLRAHGFGTHWADGAGAAAERRAAPPSPPLASSPPRVTRHAASDWPIPQPIISPDGPAPAPAHWAVEQPIVEPEMPTGDLYEILRAEPTMSMAQLRARYVALARMTHPDALIAAGGQIVSDNHGETTSYDDKSELPTFREVAEAWKVLSDPVQRQKYDRSLKKAEYEAHADKYMDQYCHFADFAPGSMVCG